jgi:hypothetical protein
MSAVIIYGIGIVEQVEHWAQGYHRDSSTSRKRMDNMMAEERKTVKTLHP